VPKVLYIVSDTHTLTSGLLPKETSPDLETTVVLIEDAVVLRDIPARRVFALSEDLASRKTTSTFPMVSYADMLKLMFEADTVIAL
jgi:hypothetical protein